jgi:predicted RNase H-like HicB family nuclease
MRVFSVASSAAFPELPLASAQNLTIARLPLTLQNTPSAEGMIEVMVHVLVRNPVAPELPHPLEATKAVTVKMEYDEDAKAWVTYVKELRGMSTFGDTESSALDNTAEMIRGYIKSMEANGKKIPLGAVKLAELKRVVGLR